MIGAVADGVRRVRNKTIIGLKYNSRINGFIKWKC